MIQMRVTMRVTKTDLIAALVHSLDWRPCDEAGSALAELASLSKTAADKRIRDELAYYGYSIAQHDNWITTLSDRDITAIYNTAEAVITKYYGDNL